MGYVNQKKKIDTNKIRDYTNCIGNNRKGTIMTLSLTAYKNMLIAQVSQGKLTARKATKLFNARLEETA